MSRFRFLLDLARPFRGRLLLAVVLTLVFTVFALTPPLVMRFLWDRVAAERQWDLLTTTVVTVASLTVFIAICNIVNRVLIAAIGQRLVVDLRTALYRHVINLSMGFHGETGAGSVMNRLMTDVGIVQNLITGETLGIVSSAGGLLFSLGMAFYLNPKLAPVLLVMLILYAINYRKFALRIRSANLELREIMDQVTGKLQERIAGVRLVKTYCRERDETSAFLASTDRALQFGMNTQMLSVMLNATARLIGGIGSTVIWCGAAWFVLHDWIALNRPMTYGDMMALDQYVWLAINPAVSLTMVAGTITQALVSLDRILDISRQMPDIRENPNAYDLTVTRGDVRLEDVHFSYAPDKPIFQGLTLNIPAGKMTALVGHTGCGKTTVTSLVLRLWDVQGGRVAIDGHDVRDITMRSLRRHVGVVPQEPVVFEGTAFDNIAYGMPDATQEQVEEAARAAQIHDVITNLPEGYRSWIGKEGVKLSVGEKQRIAIARAILLKPAVLVLDEATSSLDSESEGALQQALRTVLRGRTSVVVAHRLSTIVEADQIIAMHQGQIMEIGTHDELMQIEGGFYRKLYEELKKGRHEGQGEGVHA